MEHGVKFGAYKERVYTTNFSHQSKQKIMKKESLWVLLCAALAMCYFTSCSKDETATTTMEEVEATTEIPVEVEGFANTRGLIVEDGEEIEVWWMTKEAIGVYGTRLTNSKFTGTNKYKNAATTTFTGSSLFSSPKYAYYPYSAENNSNGQTAVRGTLPKSQNWHTSNKVMTADYKIGKYTSRSWTGYNFSFTPVMTFVKHTIDATGTVLEGEKLLRVTMTVKTADGQPRQINGGFSMDLTRSAADAVTWDAAGEESNVLSLAWTNNPTMAADYTVAGYVAAAPLVKQGDVIDFVILTENHTATFSRTSAVDYAANLLVCYAMPLSEMEDLVITENKPNTGEEEEEEPTTPEVTDLTIHNFSFTVANNPGKILPRKFTHDSSFNAKTSTVTEEVCTVDNENYKVSVYIPYLNNRKLIPTFEIAEGAMMITYSGQIIESGVTEVDFSQVKQVAVGTSNDNMAIYDIELTNTGLPVVVINQLSGTTSSESNSDYTKASAAWYAATGTEWQPKDSDWSMEDGDDFMVYNADGTSALKDKNGNVVTEPILASTRVRGNVSQQMPKKPFAVKLDSKSAVLDMPAHKRWVLLANWKDRTLMRNELAFELAKAFKQTFPNDGMAWNPSGQHVELVYNGVYVGNYYLCEQIKIDGNRLDINEPYDAEENAVAAEACGILMESDDGYDEAYKFTTRARIPFLFKDDGTADMLTYASTFVQDIETQLNSNNFTGAYETMDITSFVDFLLVQDLMMNSEMKHPKSCYSYINNGKLYAGPVWDFDWNTLPTSTSYSEEGYSYTKSIASYGSWSYSSSNQSSPSTSDENYIWYPRLMDDVTFMSTAATRWAAVQGAISNVLAHIMEVKAQIATSAAENEKMWPVDSKSNAKRSSKYGIGSSFFGMAFSCGYCGDEGMTFDAAVNQLKATVETRISGMNSIYKQ